MLDESVVRLAEFAKRARPADGHPRDLDANHALAREAAGKGIVLLKNEGGLLPVPAGTNIAVIGEFARTPRYQGAGSSQVNPTRVDNFLDELRAAPGVGTVEFAPGYSLAVDAAPEAELFAEAVAAAGRADTVIFLLACQAPSNPRALTGRTCNCRPSSWRCSTQCARPTRTVVVRPGGRRSGRNAVRRRACRRCSPPGLAARPAEARWPTSSPVR